MYSLLTFLQLLFLTQAQDTVNEPSPPAFTFAQGGQDWGGLCATGQSQSPINILTSSLFPISDPYFSAVSLNIPPQLMPLQDFMLPFYSANGTVDAVFNDQPFQQYLAETHFHLPGEHTIDGLRYPLELHASFIPASSSEAIRGLTLAVLFQEGAESQFIDSYVNSRIVDFSLLLSGLVEDYFYYSGGREVPDCSEPNLYIVPNRVFEISTDQLNALASGPYAGSIGEADYHGLYRDIQPLNGRTVYHRVPIAESESFLLVILP